MRVLATGLRFPEGPVALADGACAVMEIASGRVTRVAADGSTQLIAETGGGPNGAALGPDGALYVCNSGGFRWREEAGRLRPDGADPRHAAGWIDRVDLASGAVRRLYESCGGHALSAPNDIVFDAHGGFYFTDTGRRRARARDLGAICYARADGSGIAEVAHPLTTPNGIALSPDQATLYWAETEGGRIWAFPVEAPGRLGKLPFPSYNGARFVANLAGLHRFDGIALEASGNICAATLISGGISVFSPQGELLRRVALDDPMTTNLCFGGPDRRTVFVTLSGRGELCALPWPAPGLPLNNEIGLATGEAA